MRRTALAALFILAACTPRNPRGTLPGDLDGSRGGTDTLPPVVDPGDGGVIPPPDASVVDPIHDSCPDFDHTFDVPIIVDDVGNQIARAPGLTSFLVPFAREAAVFSLNSLVVLDEGGVRLPAQFETLSRWGGGPEDCGLPIRYAYAHVRSVPAAGARASWSVQSQRDPAPEESPMVVTESSAEWVIDTGAARFTVERPSFRGLAKIELRDPQGNLHTVSELGSADGFVLERGEPESTGRIPAWYLALERKGGQVATIAARGYYAGAGGQRDLAYTVRLHFTAGSAAVKIDHTYYYGEVESFNADGATNTTVVGRAYLNLPLAETATSVRVRGDQTVHPIVGSARLEQEKRLPEDSAVRFTVSSDGSELERGVWADHPFLAVGTRSFSAMGTIARMAVRDPQGLRYDAATNALQLDFTSSTIQIGGARGIWSTGAIDFSLGAIDDARADALQLFAERPLLGTPAPSYVNGTETIGPYAIDETGVVAPLFATLRDIHEKTKAYYLELRVTGIQVWPDLTSGSCYEDFNCDSARVELFEGGHNNYWNWSKPGVDEFFRTGNNDYLYAYSLGEAVTYAETLTIRPDHDRIEDSSVAGLAPCYGNSRGFSGDFREGLNSRRDNCPADYSYSKTLKVAYLATGDRRFADFFEEAGLGVTYIWGAPPIAPEPYLELNLTRLSEQRLENLANGAEFSRDATTGAFLRQKLVDYTSTMLGRSMIDGHACDTASTGSNDARTLGQCQSVTGWLMPTPVDWAIRTSRFLSHPALGAWVLRHGEQAAANMTVLDSRGLPDFSQAYGTEGWRVAYRCDANQAGVVDSSCARYTTGENDSYYYQNGMMAFLNLFGLILASDPSDPNRICEWLPAVWSDQVIGLPDYELNARIWGKSSGQAFGMAAEAAGAISSCP